LGATLLAALLPGAVAAEAVTRYHDHTVDVFCESDLDGGHAYTTFFSTELDGFAVVDVAIWLDPAVPFDEPATYSGSAEAFDATEGDVLTLIAQLPIVGPDGSDLGIGTVSAELPATGPAEPFTEPGFGNHKSKTAGVRRTYDGDVTFTLDTVSVTITDCFGTVTDVDAWNTNPHSFVESVAGLDLACDWPIDGGSVDLFVQSTAVDLFADVFVGSPDQTLFSNGTHSGSATTAAMDLTIGLTDEATGDESTAHAVATFTKTGPVVTSTLVQQSGQARLQEQSLVSQGALTFQDGSSFPIDSASCRVVSFSRHSAFNQSSGPKATGRAPVNDVPSGAIALHPGSKVVTTNRGAAQDPEQPITTCPEGPFDDFGRTLWYTIEGTGGSISLDTAGSQIDTVMAVYVPDGDDLVEVACQDDVDGDPIGHTYQAALTIDTVAGTTYYIEVGGYRRFFDPETVETGQIRIAVR